MQNANIPAQLCVFTKPVFLAGVMPIGELFDLEALAEIAKKNKQWGFFLAVHLV